MKYVSTRNSALDITAAQAIAQGLAPDGGLFMPALIPILTSEELSALGKMDYRGRAANIMGRFLEDFSKEEIENYVNQSYAENFSDSAIAPLRPYDGNTAFLELWHGPTSAFKDMALQILPRLLTASLRKMGEEREVCILVATSGDTGKAALEGFKDVSGTKILVFYPRDGVSDVQRLQMVTQEGANVSVCAVNGNFDDAQTGVKAIFNDRQFAETISERGYMFSSANSINWGRLLPQIVYYFSSYCDYVNRGAIEYGDDVNFCVPTGNFGNILAGWYAREMGLPIKRLICASNRNNILTDFINTGIYDKRRDFYTTVSPSMDILISSNLERLLFAMVRDSGVVKGYMESLSDNGFYEFAADCREKMGECFVGGYCGDEETKQEIARVYGERGYLIDTHTAVASKVLKDYRENSGDVTPAIVVSTASPYKFADSVLEALGKSADMGGSELIRALEEVTGTISPKPLQSLENRQIRFEGCEEKDALIKVVDAFLQ